VSQQTRILPGVLCAFLAGGLLAGCGQPQEPPAATPPPPAAAPEAQPLTPDRPRSAPVVTLTDADADRALSLQRGQVVEIRLPADRASGYAWIPAENMLPVMSTDGAPLFENGNGAAGTEIWRFIGREPGHAHLVFEYRRLSDLDARAERTVVYHFDVE
jgi:predicted secreted protein